MPNEDDTFLVALYPVVDDLYRAQVAPQKPARRGGGRVGPTGPLWPRAGAGGTTVTPSLRASGRWAPTWATHWQAAYGAQVLTSHDRGPDRHAPPRRQVAGWRQLVERVTAALATVVGLAFPQPQTRWGVLTRVAATRTALKLGLWLTHRFHRPPCPFASRIACYSPSPISQGRG